MSDREQTTGEELAEAGAVMDAAQVETAQAAMSAAASEFTAELHSETAQAAAELAVSAALDNGKLDAILEAVGRMEGHLAIISAAPAVVPVAEPTIDEAAIVEAIADELEEPEPTAELEEATGETADVEGPSSPPPGRKKKPGLMRRRRG